MGGTYGGNAVGCAAALGVLEAFRDEKVLENVRLRERQALDLLGACVASLPAGFVREVRGKGLMLGIEFERRPGAGHGARAAAVVQASGRHDLLTLSCGPYDTLRLIPPLTVSDADMAEGMRRLARALHDVVDEERKASK
jgi:4-aminobutyrate aminotransferase